jgi:hypothetical protein
LIGLLVAACGAGAEPDYRILTPPLRELLAFYGEKFPPCQLPVFDASVFENSDN